MVLPIGEHARSRSGPAQERAVGRGGAAEHDVVAAAGAGVAAVEHEFLGAEPRSAALPRRASSVMFTSSSQLRGGMDVDLDHAGIGRDLDDVEARIAGRRDSPR